MSFCLLPDKIAEFKQALKSGMIDIKDLINMSTEERTKLFEKYAGDNAKAVNRLFEEKLVLKNRMLGLKNFMSKIGGIGKYSAEGKAEVERTLSEYRAMQQERIFNPKENQSFLNDLADKKLGVHISREVAAKVFELSAKADAAREMKPTALGVSDEYLKAKGDLNSYVAAQMPTSALSMIFRNITTTMRNFLLMNPSTPLKTLTGQLENTVLDSVTRRIATLSASGKADSGVVKSAAQDLWQTFRKTGLNGASMGSTEDIGKLGEGHRFETPSGALSSNPVVRGIEAGTRFAAKWTNKISIDWEHNIAFTKFYQKNFIDMANIAATKLAKGADPTAIFKDAMRAEPETEAGQTVRDLAQKNAARVVGTQETVLSKASSSFIRAINDKVPGLGDFLFQIVKIPTNLISYGFENAGIGLLTGPDDMLQGRKLMASSDPALKLEGAAQFAKGTQTLIRTVGIMAASLMISNSLNKNDFKTDRYGSSYVNIGGTWINMEYFYAINPSLGGFMEMKKSAAPGQNVGDKISQYVSGAGQGLKHLPILNTANTIATDLTNPSMAKGVGKYVKSDIGGRLQPAFLKQLENGQGIKGLFFSTSGLPTRQEMAKLGAK